MPDRRIGDHDTIIEIKTKLDRLIMDVADIKTNTTQRVELLETSVGAVAAQSEANGKLSVDHETRLRRLEVWGFGAIGAIAVLELIIKYFNK